MSCWSLPLNKKPCRGSGTSPCLSVNFAELNSLQTTPSYSLCTKSINAHKIRDMNIPQTGPNNSKGNFHVAARATACYSTYPHGTAASLHAWINKAFKTRLHLRYVRFRRASPVAESPLKSQIALYWSSLPSPSTEGRILSSPASSMQWMSVYYFQIQHFSNTWDLKHNCLALVSENKSKLSAYLNRLLLTHKNV